MYCIFIAMQYLPEVKYIERDGNRSLVFYKYLNIAGTTIV